uniref:Carbohydrate sulfotransferase n=1 Tax=Saccoglossus kowalevskii TaxID=10224 RepID=A0ABM0MQ93_SACKO|nr:PREDICTED: carbohydrate sulfotransferase 8-like [Saccoglossus kowalevskii]
MEEIQKKRKGLIKKICAGIQPGANGYYKPLGNKMLIFNDQYKFLYCKVPKVAGTSWRRVLLVLTGVLNSTAKVPGFNVYQQNYPSISQYKNNRRNYTSFVFVRHPFHRLLSAYRNKLEKTVPLGFEKIAKQIISQYRHNTSFDNTNSEANVSFPEFIQFLLNFKSKSNLNKHYDFQHKCCAVCEYSYDFIGHFENIVEESNYLLHSLGITRVSFPEHDVYDHATNSTNNTTYMKYYSQVPSRDIIELYKLYEMDFKLFGYPFPKELV